jgi:hypothetical protein
MKMAQQMQWFTLIKRDWLSWFRRGLLQSYGSTLNNRKPMARKLSKAKRIENLINPSVQEALEREQRNYNFDLHQIVGRTSRSASEAFRDAEYAYAIHKFDDDWAWMVRRFYKPTMDFVMSAFLGGMAVGFIYWITR